jgi:hypothetical protein
MAPQVKARNLGTPPILAGGRLENGEVIYQKDFAVGLGVQALRDSLMEWLGRYVSRTSVVPLMLDADSLPEIMSYWKSAPPPMRLPATRRISMHLMWNKLSNAQWYVEGVGFSLKDNVRTIQQFNQRRLREHLLDKAEVAARSSGLLEPRTHDARLRVAVLQGQIPV